MTTTNPTLLKMPLARDGDKTAIPETAGSTTGDFSEQYGFQQINQLPLGAGGIAPKRNDFNGVFNLLGGINFFAQKGWTFHYDSTQDYYLGCVVIDPADGNRYECIADMPAGTVAPHDDSNGTYWRRYTLGDGVPLGTILPYSINGSLPSGYLECDGSAVSRTMYPDLFAAIGTTYGAGDGSTTFNLPNLSDGKFAEGSTVAGTVKQAGLPNITGSIDPFIHTSTNTTDVLPSRNYSGSMYSPRQLGPKAVVSVNGNTGSTENVGLAIDASRSSSIYGNSSTVQPYALTTRYIIKAFDGMTADSALIDVTQYAGDLATRLQKQQVPAFNKRDVITTSGTYTAPVTGWYKITVKGGGSGGQGGGKSSTLYYAGYGGCEGGTTIAYEYMTAGDIATVVIGAGGAGGASSTSGRGAIGSAGGSSTVTISSNTYTANGASAHYGGSGIIKGAAGGVGQVSTGFAYGGNGGGVGGGGLSFSENQTPYSGTIGGGGAGGYATTTDVVAGGAGGNGYVWFEYFYKTTPN